MATQQEPPHHLNPCVNFSQASRSLVTHNSFNNSIIKHLKWGYWKFIRKAFTLDGLHILSLKANKRELQQRQNMDTSRTIWRPCKRSKVIFVVIVKEGTALHRIQMAETSKMIDSTTFHKHYTRLNIVITELWGPELWALRSADQRGDKPLC